MAYQIEVKVRFRAGHRLLHPYVGKCNNPHGEGYTLICILEKNELDDKGLVLDFGEVKKSIQALVDNKFDHAYMYNKKDDLGKIFKSKGFKVFEMEGNPTAENMAKMIFEYIVKIFPSLIKVGVVESFDDSIAWYKLSEERIIQEEKFCCNCNKPVKYSEFCLFHYTKKRFACSQKCFFEFMKNYMLKKDGVNGSLE